jgi:hypothetical protein
VIERVGSKTFTQLSKLSFNIRQTSGSSLPLIFCIHVRSGPIYWGGVFTLQKKIIRWWYFTCKKPKNIICDGILNVNMFHYLKIPHFTCTFFHKIYLQWIYWTLFFIARCSTIFASELPERQTNELLIEKSLRKGPYSSLLVWFPFFFGKTLQITLII